MVQSAALVPLDQAVQAAQATKGPHLILQGLQAETMGFLQLVQTASHRQRLFGGETLKAILFAMPAGCF